jgi:hypothetical protein
LILGLAHYAWSSSARAQELSVYVGAGVGEFDHDNERGGAFSDSVSSWKIYGGFQAGEYFSLEVGYAQTDTIEAESSGSPLSIFPLRLNAALSVDFEVTTVRAMGRLPFDRLDLWLGYGIYNVSADVDVMTGGTPSSLLAEDQDQTVAFGVDWKFGRLDQPIRVRLEYERLLFKFSDASTVAVGIAYRFGDL